MRVAGDHSGCNDDHFYTWWWYWRWCLPALQGAVQLRLRVTRPKLHYWILSNSQIGTFQFSRRWRWQQWWGKQICFQPRLQLQLPFTPKAALSGFPQTSEPWNVDNKIFPTAWVRKDFEVSSKLSKFIVGSLSDPSPSPRFKFCSKCLVFLSCYVDLSKLIHGCVKVVTRIRQSWSIYLLPFSKLVEASALN